MGRQFGVSIPLIWRGPQAIISPEGRERLRAGRYLAVDRPRRADHSLFKWACPPDRRWEPAHQCAGHPIGRADCGSAFLGHREITETARISPASESDCRGYAARRTQLPHRCRRYPPGTGRHAAGRWKPGKHPSPCTAIPPFSARGHQRRQPMDRRKALPAVLITLLAIGASIAGVPAYLAVFSGALLLISPAS